MQNPPQDYKCNDKKNCDQYSWKPELKIKDQGNASRFVTLSFKVNSMIFFIVLQKTYIYRFKLKRNFLWSHWAAL